MVASMTAFGRARNDLLEWEIRSVNHRYLELGFRLPEPLRGLERALRERAAGRIQRGKVDATLRLGGNATPTPKLNGEALRRVIATVRDLAEQAETAAADPLELLRWPGVLEDDKQDLARLEDAAVTSFEAALGDLVRHRRSEGARIEAVLRERLTRIDGLGKALRGLADGQRTVLFGRLRRRVEELTTRLDPLRLEQEVAILAQKADVTEELDRLDIHVAEAGAGLDGQGPCGRRLDFLLQELNREANTLAAKSALPESARLAVDLKVAIEQMREQVQNVE